MAIVAKAVLCQDLAGFTRSQIEMILDNSKQFKYYLPSYLTDQAIIDLRVIDVELSDEDSHGFKWTVKNLENIFAGEVIATYKREKKNRGYSYRKDYVTDEIVALESGTLYQFRHNKINYGIIAHATDGKNSIKAWVKEGRRDGRMNLTDLQVELRNIEEHLALLHNEIDKMKPKSEEEKKADFTAIDKLAAKNPINNTLITAMPETSKRIFFGSLSYILLSIEKDIYARLLYLTRLSIGSGIGWNAESLYKSGLEVDDFDMIIKEMEGYKDTFLTEAFIISNIKETANEKTLSVIADIAKAFGCDAEELRVIAQVAKCRLMDDTEILLNIPIPTENRWMNRLWNYIPYEWIVKNRKEVGVICTKKYKKTDNGVGSVTIPTFFRNSNRDGDANDCISPCKIKERVQAGSIVRTGDIIWKYTQKQKLKKKLDYGSAAYSLAQRISASLDETEVKDEENVIEAPCDGIVFFINDSRKSEVNGKLDEYVVTYIVSYFDYYNDFDKWFKAKGV